MGKNIELSTPTLQAIVLSKSVEKCCSCERNNILKIFNSIRLTSMTKLFPDRVSLYYAFTDIRRKHKINFQIVYLKLKKKVYETSFNIKADNPFEIMDGYLSLANFPLPGEGVYSLEFWCENQELGSVRLTITKTNWHKIKK